MRYTDYIFNVPEEKVIRLMVNTDAKNEADDQFAIVHALLSPKFENVGFIAAHYGERHSDAMERSYQEIETIFDKMGFPKEGMIFRGAKRKIENEETPQISEGAQRIVHEAMKKDARPFVAIFLGPLTDLASALLMEPSIAQRMKAIWIGGGSYPHGGPEFNCGNDIDAVNVVFKSKMEIWQVPKNVYEMIPVSLAELEYKIHPYGEIGRYLLKQLDDHALEEKPRTSPFRTGETWVLGDSPAVGLLLYEQRFEFDWIQAPIVTKEMAYVPNGFNRPIRVYRNIDSRLFLDDFFAKVALFHKKHPNGLQDEQCAVVL